MWIFSRFLSTTLSKVSQLFPRLNEILVVLASKYMGLMGDSGSSIRHSALILVSVTAPSDSVNDGELNANTHNLNWIERENQDRACGPKRKRGLVGCPFI